MTDDDIGFVEEDDEDPDFLGHIEHERDEDPPDEPPEGWPT